MAKMRVCGIVALLAMTVAAFAYPTLSGPTGQAVIPTAVAEKGFGIAADIQSFPVDPSSGTAYPIRALLGVGSNVELGATYDPLNNSAPFERAMGANAKFRLATFLGGNSALGAQYRTERLQNTELDTRYWQGYFAWTTRVNPEKINNLNLSLTWGANWTNVKPEGFESESGFRFNAGAALLLTQRLALMAEYQTKSRRLGDLKPTVAVSARGMLTNNIGAQIGLTNSYGLTALDKQRPFGGLFFRFGPRGVTGGADEVTISCPPL